MGGQHLTTELTYPPYQCPFPQGSKVVGETRIESVIAGAIIPEVVKMNKFRKFTSAAMLTASLWICFTCTATTVYGRPTKLSSNESATLRKWWSAQTADHGAINLADPDAEAMFLDTLRLHGITRESRPYLFATLDKIKHRQMELMAQGKAVDDDECKTPTELGKLANFRELLDVVTPATPPGNTGFTTVGARAIDSIYESAQYVLDTLDVYDENLDEDLASGKSEGYAPPPNILTGPGAFDPRFVLINAPGSLNNNPSGEPIMLYSAYLYRDTKGQTHSPCYILQGPTHLVPKSLKMADPSNQKSTPGSNIVICLNRANANNDYKDCDYGPLMPNVANDKAHVEMIVNGSIQYNDPVADITDPGNFTGDMTVIPRDTGGGCPLTDIGTDSLLKHFTVDNKDTLTFSWGASDPADFGALCWQVVGNNQIWDFALTTKTKTLNGGGKPTWSVLSAFLSESNSATANASTHIIPQIVMQFGCIRKGQKVLMGDGRTVPIEDIKVGDIVQSTGGAPLKVGNVTTGEDNTFYKISVAGNERHSLFVTATHPIPIEDSRSHKLRIVQAQNVKAGQSVHMRSTSAGASDRLEKIVEVTEVDQPDEVFNLTLERTDGNPIKPEAAMFYTEDIEVGDNALQGKLAKLMNSTRTAVKRWVPHLSGSERIDYQNWLRERSRQTVSASN